MRRKKRALPSSSAMTALLLSFSMLLLWGVSMACVTNVTAEYVTEAEDVKPLLERQVSSSVRWEQTMRMMLADGVDTFIEIGPGKTLAGFMKKIDRSVRVINIEKLEDIEKVRELL